MPKFKRVMSRVVKALLFLIASIMLMYLLAWLYVIFTINALPYYM